MTPKWKGRSKATIRSNRVWKYVIVCLALSTPVLGYLSWRFERWFNWEWDYGQRVESRIEELEERVERLERSRDD